MTSAIEPGFMVFLADGKEGIAAVRRMTRTHLVVYVENAGEFELPLSTVTGVHSQKVMLDASRLDNAFLDAVGHAHDREDPKLAG